MVAGLMGWKMMTFEESPATSPNGRGNKIMSFPGKQNPRESKLNKCAMRRAKQI